MICWSLADLFYEQGLLDWRLKHQRTSKHLINRGQWGMGSSNSDKWKNMKKHLRNEEKIFDWIMAPTIPYVNGTNQFQLRGVMAWTLSQRYARRAKNLLKICSTLFNIGEASWVDQCQRQRREYSHSKGYCQQKIGSSLSMCIIQGQALKVSFPW